MLKQWAEKSYLSSTILFDTPRAIATFTPRPPTSPLLMASLSVSLTWAQRFSASRLIQARCFLLLHTSLNSHLLGSSHTNLHGAGDRSGPFSTFIHSASALLAQSPEMGATPVVMAATEPHPAPGTSYGPGGLLQGRGWPTRISDYGRSNSKQLRQEQWERMEEWAQFRYPGSPN